MAQHSGQVWPSPISSGPPQLHVLAGEGTKAAGFFFPSGKHVCKLGDQQIPYR